MPESRYEVSWEELQDYCYEQDYYYDEEEQGVRYPESYC